MDGYYWVPSFCRVSHSIKESILDHWVKKDFAVLVSLDKALPFLSLTFFPRLVEPIKASCDKSRPQSKPSSLFLEQTA